MPPEGVFLLILRAVKYFTDDKFLMQNSDKQIRLLANIFEKCTLITLNQNKVYDILRS